jgi:hypothetical protein
MDARFRGAPAGEFRSLTLENVAALAIGLASGLRSCGIRMDSDAMNHPAQRGSVAASSRLVSLDAFHGAITLRKIFLRF